MREKIIFIPFCRSSILLLLILYSSSLLAQTAHEMAKDVEDLYTKGAATVISFSLDGDKNMLTFDGGSKFRIDNPTDLIISDGTTIWHYTKQKKEVVVDKVNKSGSSLSSAGELIKLSTNYSSVLSRKGKLYELQLTPNASISRLMESLGGLSQLVFSLTKTHSGVDIRKVSAKTSKKNFSITNVKIKSLSKLNSSLFSFGAPKGTNVIDLRD
jgi:outer membrane lipoprotein-sorting protein